MTRIYIHIGPDRPSSDRIQRVLDAARSTLAEQGVLYPRTPGAGNHTRLVMAVGNPHTLDALRFHEGLFLPAQQAALRETVGRQLAREVADSGAQTVILSAHQLGSTLSSRAELARLRALLAPVSDDIRIVAWLDEPARALVAHYGAQVLEGRARSLDLELGLLEAPDFWQAALDSRPAPAPLEGVFPEVQGAAFWLDYKRMQREWESVFGQGSVAFRSLDRDRLYGEAASRELCAAFGIAADIGPAGAEDLPRLPAAPWLTRCRQFNDAALRLLARQELLLPRTLWRKLLAEIEVPGGPLLAGSLSALSMRFDGDIADLCTRHDGLDMADMEPDPICGDWVEADPTRGFQPHRYLMAFRWRIAQADKAARAARGADSAALTGGTDLRRPAPDLRETPQDTSTPQVRTTRARGHSAAHAPHTRPGRVNEAELAAAYTPVPPRRLSPGSTGNVIVACMQNEGPYVVEWIAYHRAIGFDNFLIYTHDCTDGTVEILNRLQDLGVAQQRDNSAWQGKSPQQHALDAAQTEPMLRAAEWIAAVDVDEFINIRCGNGTLADVLARVPQATNVAMTRRLFGHNGIKRVQDRFVIEQFDSCAPHYCPKPQTARAFKTLFRNIAAYERIGCHRPDRLAEGHQDRVTWVNGSGRDMTADALESGWHSSQQTIGYDLIQLNHYALRSAESFLIKRQRGRTGHVDRKIGLNYWIRMDWSVHRDITIKRNIPRLRAEVDRLMQDPALRAAHRRALEWHQTKAAELRDLPEFADLYRQALMLDLTETERAAYALALDMDP